MGKTQKNYYLGLDIGTNSIGWAVVDERYHIMKFHGKLMWGSRLFDEAKTAENRRQNRATRRRLQRRRQRLDILQELFAEEICKVDPGFYQRLKDSALYADDKDVEQSNSLFADALFCDKDYHDKYPTIYHLRRELLFTDKKMDIRLVYLTLHHIMKHRGHFLYEGNVRSATSFETSYRFLVNTLSNELDLYITCTSEDDLENCLKNRSLTKRDRNGQILQILSCENETDKKVLKAIVGFLAGSKVKISEVYRDVDFSELEHSSFSFADASYDEIRSEIEQYVQERIVILDAIKGLYDWGTLAEILEGGELDGQLYLSVAKVKAYNKHREDLKQLKALIQNEIPQEYNAFFRESGKDNYCAYIGSTKKAKQKKSVKRCSYDEFAKATKKILSKIENSSLVQSIVNELDAGTYLPLLSSKDNSVIPYQVHEMELCKILYNASQYYDFLNEKDGDGYTICDKVKMLFKFRIPYYVGPLNTSNGKNCWMVRKADAVGTIRPWNFEKMVDVDKSAEKFIRRMTNKCTYLWGKDVLPKYSLLYMEFMVWNELNNVKIRDEYLEPWLKKKIFQELFMTQKHITGKKLFEFLRTEGYDVKREELSGFDTNFQSSLTSFLDMKKIFGEEMKKHSVQNMVEQIILWITLYGEESKMLRRVIRSTYSDDVISDEQLNKICRLKYKGWGRLSREFLSEVEGISEETGVVQTIIQALRDTNDNLMKLLSGRYTYKNQIDEINKSGLTEDTTISYENLMQDLLASPAIKRAAWQVVLIAEEVRKIMGREPQKIFVEMARGPEEKKRTESRKEQLVQLYKNIKDEERAWKEELEKRPESDFRSIKLYLYYLQRGRCMYTGRPIDLSQLADAQIYDRDHIYPQSKTKDDSLNNLVLVDRRENLRKTNDIIPADVRNKMRPFWEQLKKDGLLTTEKFHRLVRNKPLSDEELAGFINRQMVETRQSSKVVAELFQRIYSHSEVVYVKAKAVSDFRRDELRVTKCRSLNDYHHAKDAYLNVVVGNVYHEKFTSNPLQWLRTDKERNYSLNKMFSFDIVQDGRVIWKPGKNGTIQTVQQQYKKKDIQYTRMAVENTSGQNGGMFDSQIVSADKNPSIPIKKGMDVSRYGGYKTITPAYFVLVESQDKKSKLQRSIEAMPLYRKEEMEKNPTLFLEYCEKEYGLKNPRIVISKIKKNSLISINGFPMHLRGTTGKQLVLQGAIQLILEEEQEVYLKKIEKYINRNQEKAGNDLLDITEMDGITVEGNIALYDTLLDKQKNTIYQYRPASQVKVLEEKRDLFMELPVEKQCILLNEILHLLQCKSITTANMTLIGESASKGKLQINKVISNYGNARVYHQSITGLYEQAIDLLND